MLHSDDKYCMDIMRKLIDISTKLEESSISKADLYTIYPENEGPDSDKSRYIIGADIPAIKFLNLKHVQGEWVPDTSTKYVVGGIVPKDKRAYTTYLSWAKDTRSTLKMNANICNVTLDGKPSKNAQIEKIYKPVQLTDEQLFSIMRPIFATKYPNIELYVVDSGEGTLITTDKTGSSSYTFGNKDNHFSITLNAGGELEYGGIIENMIYVYDATAGEYAGVITAFFDAIFKSLESEITPEIIKLGSKMKRILAIDDDKSHGAWKAIAKSLGSHYETT